MLGLGARFEVLWAGFFFTTTWITTVYQRDCTAGWEGMPSMAAICRERKARAVPCISASRRADSGGTPKLGSVGLARLSLTEPHSRDGTGKPTGKKAMKMGESISNDGHD